MTSSPFKLILIVAALAAGAFSIFYATRGRAPACSANGKYMSTIADCKTWGLTEEACAAAVAKARAVAIRAAPKATTALDCEMRFADCFDNGAGGFTPRPSFCLKSDGEPSEIRYLEYQSDRRNRKTTREVPIN
jgi:uncharacterized protein YgiB involved in biofilm formation